MYCLSVVVATAVGRSRLPLLFCLALAPVVVYAWLWLGADGNTAKAGQTRQSGEDPAFQPRSVRHRVMLEWHELCDRVLGDIASRETRATGGAGYGDRTRLTGLGSQGITTMLSPRWPLRAVYHERISARTSSRLAAIISGVAASRFKRSSGSVLDGRTLKCQPGYSIETPSSVDCSASA